MLVRFGEKRIKDNETLPIQIAQQYPVIQFNGDPNTLYTLIMYDLDAPQGPFIHYKVSNIPGGEINRGDVIIPYTPPNPPSNTGVHTYVIDVLSQNRILPAIQESRNPISLESLMR